MLRGSELGGGAWSLEDELEEPGAWRTSLRSLEEELKLGGELPKFGAWSQSKTHAGPR